MEYIKLTREEYAKVIALLNSISDTTEEALQKVFTVEKATKGKMNELYGYESMLNINSDANEAWNTLTKARNKIRIE